MLLADEFGDADGRDVSVGTSAEGAPAVGATFQKASAAGGVGTASGAAPPRAASEERKGKIRNKPNECAVDQPLKELRLGRCFTYKQSDYQYLHNMLEKVFKEKTAIDDKSNSSGHGRPVSSNLELQRGQESEASQTLPSSTWMSLPTSMASLAVKDEHLVRPSIR